jgi:hypothetical protein
MKLAIHPQIGPAFDHEHEFLFQGMSVRRRGAAAGRHDLLIGPKAAEAERAPKARNGRTEVAFAFRPLDLGVMAKEIRTLRRMAHATATREKSRGCRTRHAACSQYCQWLP